MPCLNFQLCLVLNLGLPCSIHRASRRPGGSSPPNDIMLGTTYSQTFALYVQGLGESEGNFYWKEKLTQHCLFGGVARPLLHPNEHGPSSAHVLH